MLKALESLSPSKLIALTLVLLMLSSEMPAQQSAPLTVSSQTVTVNVSPAITVNLSVSQNLTLNLPPVSAPLIPTITVQPLTLGSVSTICKTPVAPTAIIRDCDLGATSFEANMVATWLAIHNLPQSDADLIYKYGNEDLRDTLRAFMFDYIKGVIREDPARRAANPDHVQLFNWIQEKVRQNEIVFYNTAKSEISRFNSNPCKFTLNADVVRAYGTSFDNIPWCFSDYNSLFNPPKKPKSDYYRQVGQIAAYSKAVSSHPGDAKVNYETQALAPESHYYIALGPALFTAAATSIAIAQNITTVAPFAQRRFLKVKDVDVSGEAAADEAAIEETAAEAGAEAGEEAASAGAEAAADAVETGILEGTALADVVGVFAIVLVAIEIAVTAGLALKDDIDNDAAVAAIQAHDGSQTPDLVDMIQDPNEGYIKIYHTFLAATLPDTRAPQPLPTPSPDGRVFITDATSHTSTATSFSFINWDPGDTTFNVPLTAHLYNGWFLQTGTTTDGKPVAQFTTKVRYTDPATNTRYAADRLADGRFLVHKDTKAIAGTDVDCPVDSTGKTPTPVATTCKDFVTDTLHLQAGDKSAVSVRLPQPPVFINPYADWYFTVGVSGNFPVQVDGTAAGLPCTLSTASTLPNGLSIVAGGISGTPGSNSVGAYPVSLVATCAGVSSRLNTTLHVGPVVNVSFTWPKPDSPQIVMTRGRLTEFYIMASGSVTNISAGAQALPLGMTISSVPGGFARVSGIPLGAPACGAGCDNQITAVNNQGGRATMTLNYRVDPPILPSPVLTQTINWYQGQENRLFFDGTKANVKLLWTIHQTLPSYATFTPGGGNTFDTTDNTAVLSGTPPVGPTSSFSFDYDFTPQGNSRSRPYQITINVLPPVPILTTTKPLLFRAGHGIACPTQLLGQVCTEGVVVAQTQSGVQRSGTWTVLTPLPTGLTAKVSSDKKSISVTGVPGINTAGSYKINMKFVDPAGAVVTRAIPMIIDEPADLSTFPTRIVLWQGVPSKFSFTATKGFPRQAAVSPGDGLPATTGTLLLFQDPACGYSCGAALDAANNGINFGFQPFGSAYITGTPRRLATYHLQVYAQTMLTDPLNGPTQIGKPAFAITTVIVAKPGDANLDGSVDCSDVNLVKTAFGSHTGGANFNDLADVNHDGLVNVLDLSFIQARLPKGLVCH